MPCVQARYMSGDTVDLGICSTINDVRVAVACRHDKFAPDVAVTSADYVTVFTDDDAVAPAEVAIVLKEEPYDENRWHAAFLAHGKARDTRGIQRAMQKVEHGEHGSSVAFCGKALHGLVLSGCTNGSNVDERCLSLFIECGADVRYADARERTALMLAADQGRADLTRQLLAAAADIHKAEQFGRTALTLSARKDHLDVVRALIAAAADVNHAGMGGLTALWESASNGHVDVVRALIAAAGNVNHSADCGGTALTMSALHGQLEVVDALIGAACDINHANHDIDTALTVSASQGHAEVVRALIAGAASINHAGRGGATALNRSANHGHSEILRILVSAAANINCADNGGKMPLSYAIDRDDVEMARMLLDASAEIDQAGADKYSALMVAASQSRAVEEHICSNAPKDTNWFAFARFNAWLSQCVEEKLVQTPHTQRTQTLIDSPCSSSYIKLC